MTASMDSIHKLHADTARNLDGIFFDIDDTFTTRGKIPAVAFQALWDLKQAGLRVVPITGRPAGWCDHIARMWPVDSVVGENGAFYFWLDEREKKLKRRFLDSEAARREKRLLLRRIEEDILGSIPGTAIASDQPYRETDLAVDFCEDVEPLDWPAIERICDIFKKNGATCKVSSIHVNGWFGDYNKLGMAKKMAGELWGVDLDASRGRYLFCGDSPNDEPMFEYFPYSAGVNNLLCFAGKMGNLPTFLADSEGGEGFAEIVRAVLSLRG